MDEDDKQRPALSGKTPRGRAALAWAPCALFSVAALAGFIAVVSHGIASTLTASLVWGALVLTSLVGWGTLLAWRLVPGRPVDPALRAAWGVAVLVAAGGVLSLLCLVSRGRIAALVAGGLLAVALDLGARREALLERALAAFARRPRALGVAVGFAALGLLALVQAASAGLSQSFYWNCDDGPAYLVFPAEMLSAGCSVQPYSVRGLNSYGGQPFLNAIMMAELPTTAVFLFDRGLCLLIAFGLVAWYPLKRRALALLPLALLVTLPDVRANTTATMSAAVLLIAAFRTLELPASPTDDSASLPRGAGAILALLVASLAALRQSNLVPAAAIVAFAYGALLTRAMPGERRALLRQLRRVALLAVALLAPWMLSQLRSARALAHPIFSRNYHPEIGAYTAEKKTFEVLQRFWGNFSYDRTIKTLPLFLLAGLLLKETDRKKPLAAIYWASVVGTLALIWAFAWGNQADNERLLFSSAVATCVCITLAALRKAEEPIGDVATARLPETFLPALVACAALLIQVDLMRGATRTLYTHQLDALKAAQEAPLPAREPQEAQYRALQAAIPEGARVLAMLDQPYRFDFRRNHFDVIDLPGMVSPRPGLPLDSDDAFAAYLLGQKTRYFAFVRKESSIELYKQATWAALAHHVDDPAQKTLAPIFFRTFERAESLTRTRTKIYEADGMVVVDLATPAGKPAAPP